MTLVVIILILGAMTAGVLFLKRRPARPDTHKHFPKEFSAATLTETFTGKILTDDQKKAFGACLEEPDVAAIAVRGVSGLVGKDAAAKKAHAGHCVFCAFLVRAAWFKASNGTCPLKETPAGRAIEADAFNGFPLLLEVRSEVKRLSEAEKVKAFLAAADALTTSTKKTRIVKRKA